MSLSQGGSSDVSADPTSGVAFPFPSDDGTDIEDSGGSDTGEVVGVVNVIASSMVSFAGGSTSSILKSPPGNN